MKAIGLVAVLAAVVTGVGCNAIESQTSPPMNSCPLNPCSQYVQAGAAPTCTSGACLVTTSDTGLVFIVDLPLTAGYAPGTTFAVLFDQFLADAQQNAVSGCAPPNCAALPPFVPVQGGYFIDRSAANSVSFPLGNAAVYTALPAQATFRLLWPPGSGISGFTAEAQGLPVGAVQTVPIAAPLNWPGPSGGASLGFGTFLPPGNYEVVLRPNTPFDVVFGPQVTSVTLASNGSSVMLPPSCPAGPSAQMPCVESFDVTRQTGPIATIPTFDIARTNGLTGWTAYLRDSSQTIVSNVAPLSGTETHVVLSTHHVSVPDGDALTGTALVIAPPLGAPFPTAVFAPIGNVLPAMETYPALPAPAVISGSVLAAEDSSPVAADLFFEAIAITDADGNSNTSNFEFLGQAQAVPGGAFGLSMYSIELPEGTYRLSVRPLDPDHQVTTVPLLVGAQNDPALGDVVVGSLRTVTGKASVADGRALSGAEVEATPVACASVTSTWCMPREATATTDADGAFQLAVDPGQYLLRVLPAVGTRLPWTSRTLAVGAADALATLATIVVPAPVAAGLRLVDPTGAAIGQAQVRFFSLSTGSAAVEVGRTVSGQDGTFEMYLAPPAQ
jgi:hypothetical protein